MKRPSRRSALQLSQVLDMPAASGLAAALLARRGAALSIDGSAVERMGGQCLQVLLAARKTWLAEGQSFQLTRPSAALADALVALGAVDLLDINALQEGRA